MRKRTKPKRTKPEREKPTSRAYRQLWRVVDGAVRDAFIQHPEYLTPRGQRSACRSITKRAVGALMSYAAPRGAAKGRSGAIASASDTSAPLSTESDTGGGASNATAAPSVQGGAGRRWLQSIAAFHSPIKAENP